MAGAEEPPDDTTLVARIRAGDERAFRILFNRWYDGLVAFGTHLVHSHAVAEDLVQDTLFRIWRNRARLEVRTSLNVYLYGAVRNAAITDRRSTTFRTQALAKVTNTGDLPGLGVTDDVPIEERPETRAAEVLRAAQSLPERCRMVFLLRWQNLLSYREIAEVMGIAVKTVEMQIAIATKALRKQFETK